MDHSLESYLKRQSTAGLQGFLQDTMSREKWKSYADAIPYILREIESRGEAIDPRFLRAWQAFLSER